jgi:hypothetical protein
MIDFRYHLVSIVAVFLALAIGLVLGSTELQGTVIDGLRATSDSLNSQLAGQRAQREAYQAQVSADQSFASANETALLKNLLTGQSVVLITEPGAQGGVVSGITTAAKDAGATITGTIALQNKFYDISTTTEAALNEIDGNFASADGISLVTASNQQTANQQQAAQLIAMASVTKATTTTTPDVTLTPTQAQSVLSTFQQGGYISGQPTDKATLAIIVTPGSAPSDGSSDPANQVLVAVAQEYAAESTATVAAGNTSGDPSGSAMSVLRSSNVAADVSTIDNADTATGQITVIQALANQAQGGKAGPYGVDSGATSGGPSPAPTPSASVTESPSSSSTKKAQDKK